MKAKTGILIASFILLALPALKAAETVAAPQAAAPAPADNSLSRIKEVRGKVIARTRYNLSVETEIRGTQSFEILLPFDEKTQLRGYRDTSEIKRGDTITAKYQQKYVKTEKDEDFVTGTVATEIQLVRSSAEGKLRSEDNP